jgi:calcium-dependent protein kinase
LWWLFIFFRWEQISPAAMDFVSKLLIFEPDKRMTAQEALSHEWISGVTKMGKKVKLDPAILARLQKYRAPDRFIREALGVMAKFLTDKEIRNLIEQFRILDNNHTGFISFKNLQDVLKNYYKESVPEEVHGEYNL